MKCWHVYSISAKILKNEKLSNAPALYRNDPEFALSSRMVMAVAFVPLQYLEEAVNALEAVSLLMHRAFWNGSKIITWVRALCY